MALGFWGGANAWNKRRMARNDANDKFLREQLEKTKSIVLPELLKKMDAQRTKISERKGRVAEAVNLGFSERNAIALERSGQLSNQLARIADLKKSEKIDNAYVTMLNDYVSAKVDNNEDLQAAITEGLAGESFISEQEQMEGLLRAIHSTTEKDFSESIESLRVNTKPLSPVDRFNVSLDYGTEQTEKDQKDVRLALAQGLAATLGTQFNLINTAEGAYATFEKPEIATLHDKITEHVLAADRAPGQQLGRIQLIDKAEDLVNALPTALRTGQQPALQEADSPYTINWLQTNFQEAFNQSLNPDFVNRDEQEVWPSFFLTEEEIEKRKQELLKDPTGNLN